MALSASPRDNTSATTPSPEPPAHLVAHPVGSAGTDNGILPLSPQHPQAGLGTPQGTGLTLAWHLVWQESLHPVGERGERGLLEAGGGAVPGGSLKAPHMQGRQGGHPKLQGTEHPGPGHWLPGRAHACRDAHTLHQGTHIPGGTSTAQQQAHKMWLWGTHSAKAPLSVQAPAPRVNSMRGDHAQTGLMGPLMDTSMAESTTGCCHCLCSLSHSRAQL